jgi:hypothetical protein
LPSPLQTEASEKTKQRIERREAPLESAQRFKSGANGVFRLQRALGNQRVAQLIKAQRLEPDGKIVGLQPKLNVGATDGRYEQEADRIAREMVSMPDPAPTPPIQRAPGVEGEAGSPHSVQSKHLPLAASITRFLQRKTEPTEVKVEEEKEGEKDELLRARFLGKSVALPLKRLMAEEEKSEAVLSKSTESLTNGFEAGDEVEAQLSQSKGQGSPLPDHVRSYMEPRFGEDFRHVRVHTSSDAIQMNRDVRAQAFTHGSDIYYSAGSSPSNLELTAHELTHVVQQSEVLRRNRGDWQEKDSGVMRKENEEIDVLKRRQQILGNHAVQRMLHGGAGLPIQRQLMIQRQKAGTGRSLHADPLTRGGRRFLPSIGPLLFL